MSKYRQNLAFVRINKVLIGGLTQLIDKIPQVEKLQRIQREQEIKVSVVNKIGSYT